jgi:hypothetical protein
MNDNQEENDNNQEQDDLQAYLSEMEHLETDFSDLEDFDMEELQEMQDAIDKVKEAEDLPWDKLQLVESPPEELPATVEVVKTEADITEEMDFSDLGKMDFNELLEMQKAIESVKHEETKTIPQEEGEIPRVQVVSDDLADRIKQELLKKKETEEEKVITPEKFLEYVKNKRNKIWYHALWYLVFEVDDHVASKILLFDVLKEVTSKSPIDPIPEHQFYFGLGYILRLNINNKQIIRYMSGGKFKININIDSLKSILEEAGEPISTRPVIEEKEKKKMYSDFLNDDFLDI